MNRSALLARLALFTATGLFATGALALGTAAGVNITNTATATYTDPGGTPRTVNSNTATVRVDEILDVTVTANDAATVAVDTPASNEVLSFTVTNTGNGSEIYALSAVSNLAGDDFDPTNVRIYLDDGDGVFSSATDTLLVPGSNDPALAADASLRVFVVSDIPSGRSDGDLANVRLVAEAITAQATPGIEAAGTVFAGQGTGGSDAVVGTTQAYATVVNGYAISRVSSTFTKASSVLNPFGGSSAVPGSTITYTLTFTATGTGNLSGTSIVDAIPTGTTYVAGSLTLDSVALTDTADADAGVFTGTQIQVGLGTVTAPATRTVTFQVTIN